MRLLNVNTLRMSLFTQDLGDPIQGNITYATLSHTWGDEEVTFQDLQQSGGKSKKGFNKIVSCCAQAKKDGIEWIWIDTCCIDKTNSAELSEAINSMYAWYQHSAVCYVFLEDVPPRIPYFPNSEFRKARWFTRGWCLQELIAPAKVEFYANDWSDIGTKWSLHQTIKEITGIPREALLERHLDDYSVAQRMSWASKRITTRVEDEAYCLLGIFDINMPLIYGEGRKSFQRLQTEIMRQEEDYSFLLWTDGSPGISPGEDYGSIDPETFSVLASKPSFFRNGLWINGLAPFRTEQCRYEAIQPFRDSPQTLPEYVSQKLALRKPPQLTSRGLLVHMFVQKECHLLSNTGPTCLLLWTEHVYQGQLVCIALMEKTRDVFPTYDRVLVHEVFLVDSTRMRTFELEELNLTTNVSRRYIPPITTEGTQSLPDLEILLSSKWNTTLRFIQSIPPIGFLTAEHSLTYNPPLGPRLYCCVLPPEVSVRRQQRNNPVLIKFQFRHTDSGMRVATGIIVAVWLDPVFPRCSVNASTNSGELTTEEGDSHLQYFQAEYDESSDRTDCEVPGSSHMLAITVKGCREPGTFSRTHVDRKPAYFTLYITVLRNGY
ncbi:hypothetical protein QQX98_002578 [Neonectria punicea]|uniref:Heterokaryon incompatibility domain-containing protein n=1 Tax=Neonectria punicea TaxID=979145 RepID=A0ABR1HI06_9HYPO